MTFDWTEERVERLKKLHATGMVARLIGERLGGARKGMVLGKLHRLGLSKPRPRAKASPRLRKGSPVRSAPFRAPSDRPPVDAPRAIPAAPNSQPCDIMGLTNENCHFPLWADDHVGPPATKLYCGAPEADVDGGRSYCDFHMRRIP